MNRPDTVVAVVATATEIGKTWATCALATALTRRGVHVAARKPAQSFDPASTEPSDSSLLAAATGEDPDTVCPPARTYPVAMAPPMAADVLGRARPTLDELSTELVWSEGTQLGLVETVGGTCSPLAADADSATFVRRIGPDLVLLVADAGLGTINAVRTALASLSGLDVVVLLNRFDAGDDLHVRNRDWLRTEDHFDVVVSVDELIDRLVGPDR